MMVFLSSLHVDAKLKQLEIPQPGKKTDHVVQPTNISEVLMPKTLQNRSVSQDGRVTTRAGLLQRGYSI